MLTNKIRLTGGDCNAPEDIFSSALGVIFPDDIINQHGDKSCSVIYDSDIHGEIVVGLADPLGENTRLFSHFVWNAAVQLAVLIEGREFEAEPEKSTSVGVVWDLKGHRVLELGAGTGLVGIVAHLMGAEYTVISDYPAPEILENIQNNIIRNLNSRRTSLMSGKHDSPLNSIIVQGHEWGIIGENDSFALANRGNFTRVIACDCLWMPWQHKNLQDSIAWFLANGGQAWIVAGFHTGRAKMKGFFEENSLSRVGLVIEKIWERNADGTERQWLVDRGPENITELKKWLTIAILRKDSCK